MPKVGIIIVNYKDYANKFLAVCRNGLEEQSYPRDNFDVYIIDNASTIKSQQYLHSQYPQAKIFTRKDGNYSAANNLGAKKAIENGCEYLVFVNMDVKFSKNWLQELVNITKDDKTIGLVQSLILLNSDPNTINSTGNSLHYLGFGFTNNYKQSLSTLSIEQNILPIKGYASGCSFLITKEIFEKIGGYNENLYMYHDDLDLGIKVKLLGLKTVLATHSVLWHKYEFSRSVNMFYYMERNRYLVMLNYYKLASLLLFLPMLIFMEIGLLFYSFFNGTFLTKLRIYLYFVNPQSWREIIKQREKNNKIRTISDRKLFKSYVGKLQFSEVDNPILQYFVNPITNIYFKFCQMVIFW